MKRTSSQDMPLMPSADTPEAHEEPRQLSLMAGVARPEDMPEATDFDAEMGGPRRRPLSQGTMLILAALVIGAGTLFLMRHTRGDLGASSAGKDLEAKIEQALAKLSRPQALQQGDTLLPANLKSMLQSTDSYVTMFTTDVTKQQVPLEYVQKDPFEIPRRKAPEVAAAIPVSVIDRQQEAKLKQLEQEFKAMALQSVMNGRVPVAIIDGELVQVGQTLGSFKVKAIGKTTVVLEAMGKEFTLGLDVEEDKGPRKSR